MFTYIGVLIQNYINFIIISNIISVSFSGWKNMSLAKLGWGVMGAIGQARDGNWFITIAFCFPSIHICLGRELGFVDLCVWIYLVWWAIITCGRKYQLSEVDAHMEDQLLLALLIGHISPISFFAICKQKMMRKSQRILILLQKRTKKVNFNKVKVKGLARNSRNKQTKRWNLKRKDVDDESVQCIWILLGEKKKSKI